MNPKNKVEDEWFECIIIWDFIEDAIAQCKLPSLGPLESFYLANQVIQKFEDMIKQHEVEIWSISSIDKGNLQNLFTDKVRDTTQLKYIFPKIDKYIKKVVTNLKGSLETTYFSTQWFM
jgi:hypothetical protein